MLCYKATQQGCSEEVPDKNNAKTRITQDHHDRQAGVYGAAFREIGVVDRQLCGGRANNRCENSYLPFRRRERAMQKFKDGCALLRNLPVITPRYTTTSIMKDI